jgi:hypothetical protein
VFALKCVFALKSSRSTGSLILSCAIAVKSVATPCREKRKQESQQ